MRLPDPSGPMILLNLVSTPNEQRVNDLLSALSSAINTFFALAGR